MAGPSNHSGPIGRGRTALQLRQPAAETDLHLTYDTEPPHPAGTMAFFRHSNQASTLPPGIDTRGLESLQLSGSERITSVEQVCAIRQACGDAPLVVVVDLRQESHGVADGHSLTWRGPMDWGNVGLDTATAREAEQLEELRRQGSAVATHADHVKGKTDDPALRRLDTTLARSEQEIVEAAGAGYRRIAVTDHLRPSRWEVDQFIALVRGLPEGAGLHVHCNGGRGRTTTFMALYDMLRNAREVDADAIMARQSKLGMDYNLADTGAVRESKQAFHADRLAFLHEFHAYARENPGGLPRTWSQWRSADAAQSS
ncbi:phosphatase [Paracidovorax cattleyae]|nr:phosphatase [Paracidovorax cattleyae]